MRKGDEWRVGLVVLVAIALVVGGALWLSDADVGRRQALRTARFRTIGGLGVGAPVSIRGVRVGSVVAIRLASDDWVEADLRIPREVVLPGRPAVIAAAGSLFGQWGANIISLDPPPEDPLVRAALAEAEAAGGNAMPGATLPDIGQLTAQASRIAGDVSDVTARIAKGFDTTALGSLRDGLKSLGSASGRLARFTDVQTRKLDRVSDNVNATSESVAEVARRFELAAERLDSATANGQLSTITGEAATSAKELRQAATDLRAVVAALRANQASLVRVVQATDSIVSRMEQGRGTLGRLSTDSTLYVEATETMKSVRQLIADIRAHPGRYLKISVF